MTLQLQDEQDIPLLTREEIAQIVTDAEVNKALRRSRPIIDFLWGITDRTRSGDSVLGASRDYAANRQRFYRLQRTYRIPLEKLLPPKIQRKTLFGPTKPSAYCPYCGSQVIDGGGKHPYECHTCRRRWSVTFRGKSVL